MTDARKVISIVTYEEAEAGSPRGAERDRFLGNVARRLFPRRVNLPAEDLAVQLDGFLDSMAAVLARAPASVGGLHLETVTLTVEVSAKGHVSLLGTGGELAGKGGMTFTLKRVAQAVRQG